MPRRQSSPDATLCDAAVCRRSALMLLGASVWPVLTCLAADHDSSNSPLKKLLQAGGCVVLLRHAATDPGSDPPIAPGHGAYPGAAV